ncbi:hypothetical protein ONE63_009116 [Megalurothrips usitatus]|uniref:Protein Wnt n=1 Tax=Megalurothrips usitatus TaxID=439358 RepID=A0AAV7XIL7_9NEOP|nr:hypothetical protein ONE63_009116 [Megalurothrips usitatus]
MGLHVPLPVLLLPLLPLLLGTSLGPGLGPPPASAANANWMYLGLVGVPPPLQQAAPALAGSGDGDGEGGLEVLVLEDPELAEARAVCGSLPGLVGAQTNVCMEHPSAIRPIAEGARRGILECQFQFRHERWNCSTNEREQSVFGYILERGSKETAFIYAVTSAGVAHAVTQACSGGELTDCGCDPGRADQRTTPQGWKWGGCSDNLEYGLQFSRRFVDAPERTKANSGDPKARKAYAVRARMNLHNNEAGRQVVSSLLRMHCRCHGVSGSCELKTCWRTLPAFSEVGDLLKRKYRQAVQITNPRGRRRMRRKSKNPRSGGNQSNRGGRGNKWKRSLSKGDLVHIHKSPDYCVTDPSRGIAGTSGRACNKTGSGAQSCDLLCCGRGYNTQVVKHVERCHCKFVWCCYVTCKTCETVMDRHTCK